MAECVRCCSHVLIYSYFFFFFHGMHTVCGGYDLRVLGQVNLAGQSPNPFMRLIQLGTLLCKPNDNMSFKLAWGH